MRLALLCALLLTTMAFAWQTERVAEGPSIKYDPTISLGSIIAVVGLSITVIGSAVGIYMGMVAHMTKAELRFEQMIERLEKLEKRQEEHSTILAALKTPVEMMFEWFKQRMERRGEERI